jgi:hypothetical protein
MGTGCEWTKRAVHLALIILFLVIIFRRYQIFQVGQINSTQTTRNVAFMQFPSVTFSPIYNFITTSQMNMTEDYGKLMTLADILLKIIHEYERENR